MSTLLPIAKVVWDPSIYPRSKWSKATIDRYADALEAGEEFPAVILEKGTDRLLDGKHRLEAHRKAGRPDIAVERRSVPGGFTAKLFAASLSARHGDRMANGDLRDVVREAYIANPEMKQKDVAAMLAITRPRVSEFASDIFAKRKEERRAKAIRLSRLGWTHDQIAESLGAARTTITEDVGKFQSELFDSGHTPEEIALRLGLPIQVVRAIQFDKRDDQARLKELGIKLQPYDVWQFPRCHDLMGDRHPGRIPGELLVHVLYFFTEPGDLVVDPMAGSGTTLDACLLMGREARGYDIDLRHERSDVEHHDLSTGWPDTVEKASLVFWDPPYFDKMDHASIGDDGYVEGSISGLDPEEYLAWMTDRFGELHKQVKPGTRFAFLMSDWDPENAKRHQGHPGIFVWDYADRLRDAGWNLRRHIQVPLSTQQVHPDIVNKFRASRRLARLERYLLVAEA